MEQPADTLKHAERGAIVSIISYVLLSAFKILVGYYAHSKALVADGMNNSTDILLSVSILIGLRIARKPPDSDHAYGHSRAEAIASLVASFFMIIAGLNILLDSAKALLSPLKTHPPDTLAAWVALLCAFVMYGVYRYNHRLAQKYNSHALLAAAKDNLSDSWVSMGAAAGIWGSQLGMTWLDPLAAFAVGALICRTAWELFRDSSHMLTDGFDESQIIHYKITIEKVKGVRRIDDIKARSHGSHTFVDLVIHVDPELTVAESHDICNEIESVMHKQHAVENVHIHMEPEDSDSKKEDDS